MAADVEDYRRGRGMRRGRCERGHSPPIIIIIIIGIIIWFMLPPSCAGERWCKKER